MLRVGVTLALLPASLFAQWLDFRTPDIPRTTDGKPNLTAPAPRTPDGKPDVSGLWQPEPNDYSSDLILNVKDEEAFRPEAEALFQKRIASNSLDSPHMHCLPEGPSQIFGTGGPDHSMYRIIQSPKIVALLYEGGGYRQFFMDGRVLPKDPNPTWYGYSVARWDGDTLVVETAGFNDLSWLDAVGHPHSEDLHVTETFRRVDFGHMQLQITYSDPKTLRRPLHFSVELTYAADTDTLEYVCNEGERDSKHYVSTSTAEAKLSTAVLSRYIGAYLDHDGVYKVPQTVTLVGGRLYINAYPMRAESETTFTYAGGTAEFVLDGNGNVSHMFQGAVEGTSRFDRQRAEVK